MARVFLWQVGHLPVRSLNRVRCWVKRTAQSRDPCTCLPARSLSLSSAANAGAVRDAARKLFRRWHPDKFQPLYGPRVAAADSVRVTEGINAVSHRLSSYLSAEPS